MDQTNKNDLLIDAQEVEFYVLGELGEGGVGEVLLACETVLQRNVAFKFLKPEMVDNADVVKRFFTEASIIAQLDHPAIIPVYRVTTTKDGRIGYTMKPINGETLTDLIRESKQQVDRQGGIDAAHDSSALLEHFVKVCDAIHYAHSKHIVHRDLKPSNIMIGPYNEVYVLDWGIAKTGEEPTELQALVEGLSIDDGELSERTQVGTIMGTPRYMSPEQAAGRSDILDARSDQFSLGLILFEIICLSPALNGKNWIDLKTKIIEAQLEPLTHYSRHENIPVELRAIIKKATQKNPDDRYPSVASFARDIRRYIKGEAVSVHKDTLAQKIMRWTAHHKQKAFVIFIALVSLSLVVTGSSLYQQQQERLQAQAEQLYMGQFLTKVAGKSQEIERRFLQFEAMLEKLAGSATQLMLHGQDQPDRYYTSADNSTVNGAPDLIMSQAYGIPISVGWPAIKKAPNVIEADAEKTIRKLIPLRGIFQQIYRSSLGLEDSNQKTFEKVLLEKGSPLVWAYVGTESGVHMAYPGKSGYPEEFDPRKRPWYVNSLSTKVVQWLPPYVDIGGRGLMLASTVLLHDDQGGQLGVAGVEMSLDTLRRQLLQMDDEKSLSTTYLLDSDGRIITSSIEEVAKFSVGTLINKRNELPVYDQVDVVKRLKRGETGHQIITESGEKKLVVFYHLDSVGWYYVVESSFSG
jgi:serine/threonine protein kinase